MGLWFLTAGCALGMYAHQAATVAVMSRMQICTLVVRGNDKKIAAVSVLGPFND